MPLATVIVTSYNRPQLLKGCIESVLNQTMPDLELFVMDDPSEHSKEIKQVICSFSDWRLKAFFEPSSLESRQIDKRFRYSLLINRALDIASGKYISYLCDDDYYFPERLEKLCGYMEIHPHINVAFGRMYSRIFGSDHPENPEIARTNDLLPDDSIVFNRQIVPENPAFFKEGPDPENVYGCDHNMVMHKKECLDHIQKPYWPEWPESDATTGDQIFFRKLSRAGFIFFGIDCWACVKRFHSNYYDYNMSK